MPHPELLGAFDFGGWMVTHTYGAAMEMLVAILGYILKATDPNFTQNAFTSQYQIMRTVGLYAIVPLMLVATLMATLRGQLKALLHMFGLAIPVAVIGAPAVIYFVRLLQEIDNNLTTTVLSYSSEYANQYLMDLTNEQSATLMNPLVVGVAITGTLVMIFCLLALGLEFFFRELVLIMAVTFMPLALAFSVWPPTRRWVVQLTEIICVLVFSKFLMVGTLFFGFAIASGMSDSALNGLDAAGQLIVGCMVIGVACFMMPALLIFVLGAHSVASVNSRDTLSQTPLSVGTGRNAARSQAIGGVKKAAGSATKLLGK